MMILREDLGRTAAAALRAHYPDASIADTVAVDRSQKADLQCSAALALARTLKKPPREVAEVIAAAFATHDAVARTDVAGPGFVNITLADAWITRNVGTCSQLPDVGHGATVVVDFSSPNVAKPMHIGHIRSTIIGDALQRVLRAVGYTVIGDNHLGDWGTQFGKLLVAYKRWVDEAAFARAPVDELLRLYVRYSDVEKEERAAMGAAVQHDDDEGAARDAPPILREARAELVKLQAGDAENVRLWRLFIDASMREFERMYARLGVRFDVTLGESFYNDRLAATVDRLLAANVAEHSQGAVVVTFDKARDGESMGPLLVRKADGGFLYGTSDIATVFYRIERWNPVRIIYVTDERQQLHFRQFFAASRRLGVTTSLEHVWFGLMRLPEGTFSTRDGNVIGLEALLDEAERRALEVTRDVAQQRGATLGADEAREIARAVGIGAVKYNDLSRDRTTLVTFTWDKALALNGNTAPYLQYAHARARSILRKAAAEGNACGEVRALNTVERALALILLGYADAVEEVARTLRPHVLCDYLYSLATTFTTFYNEVPVLKAEPEVRAARLQLVSLVAKVLRDGLALLGIDTPEEM